MDENPFYKPDYFLLLRPRYFLVGGGSHAGSVKQDAYFRSVRETAIWK